MWTIACSTLSQKVGEGNALSDVRTGPVAPSPAGPWVAWRVLPCANARWPCTPQPSRYQGLQVLTGIGRPQRPAPTRQSSHTRRDGRLTRRCRAALVGLLRDFGGSAWTLAPGGSAGLFGVLTQVQKQKAANIGWDLLLDWALKRIQLGDRKRQAPPPEEDESHGWGDWRAIARSACLQRK